MAITRVGDSGLVSGVGALTVNLPSAAHLNDTIVLIVETSGEFIGLPTGFTQQALTSAGTAATSNGVELGIWTKRAVGGETSVSVGDSGNHQGAIAILFRGAIVANDGIDTQMPSGGATGLSVRAVPPTTSANANELYFFAAAGALAASVFSWSTVQTYAGGLTDSGTFSHSNGDGGSITYAFGTRAANGTMTGNGAVVTRSTGTDTIVASGILLVPAANGPSAAVTGLMGKLTMSAVAYPDKHPAAIAGVLGQLQMSGAVVNANGISLHGVLGAFGMNGAVVNANGISLTGTLSSFGMDGRLDNSTQVSVAAILGPLTMDAELVNEHHISAAGVLTPFSMDALVPNIPPGELLVAATMKPFSFDARLAKPIDLLGTMKPFSMHAVSYVAPTMVVAGTLKKMSMHAGVLPGGVCYELADDKRERILARVWELLSAQSNVVVWGRNDDTITDSALDCITFLDGDESDEIPRMGVGPQVMTVLPELFVTVARSEMSDVGYALTQWEEQLRTTLLNDATLAALTHNGTGIRYLGFQTATANGRRALGQMVMEFAFDYALVLTPPCSPINVVLNDWPARENILNVIEQIALQTEGVASTSRNEMSLPDDPSLYPMVLILDGSETTDPKAWFKGRPSGAPNHTSMQPELYIVLQKDATEVGPALNRVRLMLLRGLLTDPVLRQLSLDGRINYDGCETALAAGRTLTGEMGFSLTIERRI